MQRCLENRRIFGRSKIRLFAILLLLLMLSVMTILQAAKLSSLSYTLRNELCPSLYSHSKTGNKVITVPPMTDVTIHKYLNIFNASEGTEAERHSIDVNDCVPLRTKYGSTPICVYDPKIDIYVSDMIIKLGSWQRDEGNVMVSILEKVPNMHLLDIGCNIGVFTLQAAKVGRRVIGIDANKFNLRLLSKSLDLGGLKNNVTLIWNAVSDIHETVTLTVTVGNIGGSFVKSDWKEDEPTNSTRIMRKALAITLEDLIYFVKGIPLFIKIDIEGSEWKAFRGGERFFQEVDVRYVLMEWMQVKSEVNAHKIIDFMTKFKFRPYHITKELNNALDVERSKVWPNDIIWIKT